MANGKGWGECNKKEKIKYEHISAPQQVLWN